MAAVQRARDHRVMIQAVLAALTVLLLVATLLPLTRFQVWWIRGLDFPRLQLASTALLLLLAQLLLLDLSQTASQVLLVLVVACGVYQLWWIVPYTRLVAPDVKDAGPAIAGVPDTGRRLRLMTANVLASNRNVEALLMLVRDNQPHILVTLESNHWWQDRLAVLAPEYPYCLKCPLENLYGMHVYSRLPLKQARIQYLVEPDVPSMHALVVMPHGEEVSVHFLHPAPPSPTENASSAERDAELLVVAKSVAGLDGPVIVAGDLNDVAWSATTRLFRKISGLLDPRIGRMMCNTYHAGHWYLRWPLDHLFHSRHFTLSFIHRLPPFGSDHFSVVVELVLHAKPLAQSGLPAAQQDYAEANEKIEGQAVSDADVHEPGR